MSVATATTRLEQRARVAPGSLMSGLRLRTNRRQQFEDDDNDPLALLDQDEDLPLDSTGECQGSWAAVWFSSAADIN